MPFKSEKQRRYLWANEPEIARDWTDTYGSRIQKSKGGITDIVTVPKHWQSAPSHPKTELAYITEAEKDLLVKKDLHNSLKDGPNTGPGGVMSLNGDLADMEAGITGADISAAERGENPASMKGTNRAAELRAGFIAAGGGGGKPGKGDSPEVKKQFKEIKKASKTRKATQRKKDWFHKNLQKKYKSYFEKYGLSEDQIEELLGYGRDLTYQDLQSLFGDPGNRGMLDKSFIEEIYNLDPSKRKKPGDEGYIAPSNPLGLMYSRTDPQSRIELPGWMGKLQGDPTYDNFMSGLNRMSHMKSVLDQDVVSQKDIDNYLSLTMGKGGVDYTGQTVDPLFTQTGGDGNNYMGYPSYEAWLAAQQQGGGVGGGETEEDTDWKTTAWNFDTTYPYPQYGAKDGGRVPRAFGGIMDTNTGRRAYGLGSIFKSVAKAAKKVLKSDVGKMAMLAGGAYLAGGWLPGGGGITGGWSNFSNLGKHMFLKSGKNWGDKGALSLGKVLGVSAALPFIPGINKAPENEDIGLAQRGGSLIDPITGKEALPREMRATLNNAIEEAGNDPVKLAAIEDAYPYLNLGQYLPYASYGVKDGGRIRAQEGGLMNLGGMEKDYRNNGGFVAIGGEERADDVPARLSRNEFVFTADAVRGAGGGDIDKGAEIMENVMKNLEQGGKISEETQGNAGAQQMFGVSERIGEVL